MTTRSLLIAVAIVAACMAALSANAQETPPRMWTNAADGRTVEAVLLAVEGSNIRFRTKDDKVFTLPVSRLVQSDQEFVANWANERGKTPVTATPSPPTVAPPPDSPAATPPTSATITPSAPAVTTPIVNNMPDKVELPLAAEAQSVKEDRRGETNDQQTPQSDPPSQNISQQPQSLHGGWRSDWSSMVRITLVALLAIAAADFGGFIFRLFAVGLVVGIFNLDAWFPPGSSKLIQFLAGFATVSCLPYVFGVIGSIRLLVFSLIFVGVPALLISRNLCGASWGLAAADAMVGVVLVPVALIRTLLRMEIIKPPPPEAPPVAFQNDFVPTRSSSRSSYSSGAPAPTSRSESRRPPDRPY